MSHSSALSPFGFAAVPDAKRFAAVKAAATAAGLPSDAWAISPRPGVYLVQSQGSSVSVDTGNGAPLWSVRSDHPATEQKLVQAVGATVGGHGQVGAGSAIGRAGHFMANTSQRIAGGIWGFVKDHPVETALTAAAVVGVILTLPVSAPVAGVAAAGGLRIAGGALARSLGAVGLRRMGLSAARLFTGRGVLRAGMTLLREVAGCASDFLGSSAKSVRSVGNSLGNLAAGTLGVLGQSGGMAAVMAGEHQQDRSRDDLAKALGPNEQGESPTPGKRNQAMFAKAVASSKGAPQALASPRVRSTAMEPSR